MTATDGIELSVRGRRRDYTSDCDETNENDIRVSMVGGLGWCYVSADMGHVTQRGKGVCSFPKEYDERAMECCRSAKYPSVDVASAYIRFGELPERGKSRNWSNGTLEPGVSCYDATWDYDRGRWYLTPGPLAGAAIAYLLQGATVYLVSGEEVGRGSDGEPCISNVNVICELDHIGEGMFVQV